MKQMIYITLFLGSLTLTACGDGFLGLFGNDRQLEGDSNNSNPKDQWRPSQDVRQEIPTTVPTKPPAQQDEEGVYVPMQIFLAGEFSGSDVLFDFFVQRVEPAAQAKKQLIMKTQGDKYSSTNTLEKACRCGAVNKFLFYWQHQKNPAGRGVLNNPAYDKYPEMQGDWIISHYVNDDGWYQHNVKKAVPGPHTIFLGADTENPTYLFGANSNGMGFLRTWCYQPNYLKIPIIGQPDRRHVWENRDDIRLALTCDIAQCPAQLQDSTELDILHHFSHEVSWIMPPAGTRPVGMASCTQ